MIVQIIDRTFKTCTAECPYTQKAVQFKGRTVKGCEVKGRTARRSYTQIAVHSKNPTVNQKR